MMAGGGSNRATLGAVGVGADGLGGIQEQLVEARMDFVER